MDSEDLLAQLADIHLPEPVNFWPPAPGWWILAALLLALAIWGATKGLAAARYQKIKAHALAELDRCYQAYASNSDLERNTLQLHFVNDANSVFKRVALYHFDSADIASLGGSRWVDFMKRTGNAQLLDDQIAEALSFGRFRTKIDVDVDKFYDFGKQWIGSLYLSQRPDTKPQTSDAPVASEVRQ
ncbi:MAG: hypothetical protein ACI95C_002888 [Pseudohongiellaceae bacterium]|jgi:hypothetical protein